MRHPEPGAPVPHEVTARYRQPGLVLADHRFSVPLDHGRPDGGQITLFAREVSAAEGTSANPPAPAAELPWLLYLQGGPGQGAPRPIGRDGWLGRALTEYRVLLLDQRGTGRSTPATRQTLARLRSGEAQARYLAHFRADSIVADAELIRRAVAGGGQWSVLGQSFGGFCVVSYLSFAPEGLRAVYITGGLPGLDVHADDVYRAAYGRVIAKNHAHYERYPGDVAQARLIAGQLRDCPATLPNGGTLTVAAFQALGIMLGSGMGSHRLHYLLEDAFADGARGAELSDSFLHQAQAELTFAAAPLYAVLHEACYGQRSAGAATRWSAERVRSEFPEFDAARAQAGDSPVLFTGEMIYPWMFRTDPALRPLREAADLLADRRDWPDLYDAARLRVNEVPAAAIVYHGDMYVDREHSLRTAQAIRGLKTWITSEYEHDGIRAHGHEIFDRLIKLARDA